MTKAQLTSLPDDTRIPAELLLDRLREMKLAPKSTLADENGGVVFFFESQVDDVTMTADIEIEPSGTVSASIIPYVPGPDGLEIFQNLNEPVDLWEIEEPPPYEESLLRIVGRLQLNLS